MSGRAILSVLLLAFVIALGAGPKRSSACTVLPSLDFAGNDITCFNADNIYGCAQKCYDTAKCIAFLWDPFGKPHSGCCLKHTIKASEGRYDPSGRTTVVTGFADCRGIFDSSQPARPFSIGW